MKYFDSRSVWRVMVPQGCNFYPLPNNNIYNNVIANKQIKSNTIFYIQLYEWFANQIILCLILKRTLAHFICTLHEPAIKVTYITIAGQCSQLYILAAPGENCVKQLGNQMKIDLNYLCPGIDT